MITLAVGKNPIKLQESEKLVPRLSQMLDRWRKLDPPTAKKLPVEADIPEYLCHVGSAPSASLLERAVGDLAVIALYYLRRIGEYTGKHACNNPNKQFNSV